MLTFLRQIRRSLINSGGTQKYLLYAIGEIGLVVIGILIALQINNWNEWRKDRVKETEILHDISDNLERNIDLMEERLEGISRYNHSTDIILSVIEKRQDYSDTLKVHFDNARLLGTYGMFVPKDGYESLKNTGFDIITNNSLKKEIKILFEVTYPETINIIKGFESSHDHEAEYIHNIFMFESEVAGSLIPKDYESILEDSFYSGLIIRKKRYRSWHFQLLDVCVQESQRVLQLIKDELGDEHRDI